MNGARDKLFAGAGFAEDQHGGVAGGSELHLRQSAFDGRTLADDFLEIEFAANFFLEIKFFDGEFVFERVDFLKSECVFNGNGNLGRDAVKKIGVAVGKSVEAPAGKIESTERAPLAE